MGRERRVFCFVSFDETGDAMAAESCFRKCGVPGRLVPLPPAVNASCGLAWRCETEDAEVVKKELDEHSIRYSRFTPVEAFV